MATKTTRSQTLMGVVGLAGVVFVLAGAVSVFFVGRATQTDAAFSEHLAEQGMLAQALAKGAADAVRGNREAFQALATNRDRFQQLLQAAQAEAAGQTGQELSLLSRNWERARDGVNRILGARDQLQVAAQQGGVVAQNMPRILQSIDLISETVSRGGNQRYVHFLGQAASFGQRIMRDVTALTTGSGDVQGASERLPGDAAFFNRMIRSLYDGDAEYVFNPNSLIDPVARERRDTANELWVQVNAALQTLTSMQATLVGMHDAQRTVSSTGDELLANTRTAQATFKRESQAKGVGAYLGYTLIGLGALAFLFLFYTFTLSADTRRAAELQAEQQERNQEAILRLLDELGSLADGDLTVQATVTEDITGAIADSINFAIEALRDLVVTINETALQVDATARQTQATASHLAEASTNQTKQITTATQQIQQMATSIEQVSGNAERSAKVAQQSVEIAGKGGLAVRRTIDGMNNIRETIQETAKRIKRLGESSQEIGNIVELINDIAEQTNILALNAAIQASMAGEAGRGFAVVADEVQRLAERSTNATKQIETLVKTIQSDTNEAVASMEQSTAGVVGGAQLAENAGAALDEIEKVSNHIATLIQSISSAARQQAVAAADVSRTMSVIQEITSQTAEGTTATARNIGKLAALATELRKSVAGFKLPGQASVGTVVMQAQEQAGA